MGKYRGTASHPVISNYLFIVKFARQVVGGFKPEKLNKDFFSLKWISIDVMSPQCSECDNVMFYVISLHNRESGC